MQLVILAAGHGRRFGGLKQLAPVGPSGEAIMDYTARSAAQVGFDGVVLVVREEIADEVSAHVRRAWPTSLPVATVCQMPLAGTAPAVLSAAGEITGAFGVANADDLYGHDALSTLQRAIAELDRGGETEVGGTDGGAGAGRTHTMVGYRLGRTLLTDAAVTRGLCEVGDAGYLERIVEQSVRRRPDGGFEAAPLGPNRKSDPDATWPWQRTGDELVSMNLWGFAASMLVDLAEAVEAGRATAEAGSELLLPDVVGDLVERSTGRVRVHATESRCIGITHPDDLDLVRREVAIEVG